MLPRGQGACGEPPPASKGWRERGWEFFDDPTSSAAAQVVSLLMTLLIALSVVSFVVQTLPKLTDWSGWDSIEAFCVALFTAEYVLRLLFAPKRLVFLTRPINLIDLCAIAPFYVSLIVDRLAGSTGSGGSWAVVRAIRMVRVFRVFKLGKYASGLDLFIKTLSLSMPALSVLAALILMILIVCSSMMYFAEHDNEAVYCTNSSIPVFARPRECHYDSIITTMWWAVVTMTTVGYGDAYPVTIAGRLLAGITMLCGVLIVALPVTVLSTNFSVVYAEWKLKNRVRLKHKAEQKKELRIAEEAEKARAAARAAGEADAASQSLGGDGDNGSSIGRLRFRRAARQALAKTKLKKVRSMPEEYMQPTPAEEFRCVLVTRTVHCPSRIDRHNICRECALPLGLIDREPNGRADRVEMHTWISLSNRILVLRFRCTADSACTNTNTRSAAYHETRIAASSAC